jgi:hypothetical protein
MPALSAEADCSSQFFPAPHDADLFCMFPFPLGGYQSPIPAFLSRGMLAEEFLEAFDKFRPRHRRHVIGSLENDNLQIGHRAL